MARLAALLVVLAAMVAAGACSPAAAPQIPGAGADVEIVSREMAFQPTSLTVPADRPFSLSLVNEDAAPHNVAIYVDSSAAESLFVGELITNSSVTYSVPPLSAGTYYFHCDLHPEMNGTLVAED